MKAKYWWENLNDPEEWYWDRIVNAVLIVLSIIGLIYIATMPVLP